MIDIESSSGRCHSDFSLDHGRAFRAAANEAIFRETIEFGTLPSLGNDSDSSLALKM